MTKHGMKRFAALVLAMLFVLCLFGTSAFAATKKNVYTVKVENGVLTLLKNGRRLTPTYPIDSQNEVVLKVLNGRLVVSYTDALGVVRNVGMGNAATDEWRIQGKVPLLTLDVSLAGMRVTIDAKANVGVLNINHKGPVIIYGKVDQCIVNGAATLTVKKKAVVNNMRVLNSGAVINIDVGGIVRALSTVPGVTVKNKNKKKVGVTEIGDAAGISYPAPVLGGGGGYIAPAEFNVANVAVTNATSVTVTMAQLSGVTFTWNGDIVTGTYAGGKYTLTLKPITKTANTLVAVAAGYSTKTIPVTITTSIDNLKLISNVTELSNAIVTQADGQSWIIKAGTYDLPRDKVFKAQGVDENWYFPIHKSILISGEGTPLLTSSVFSANGAWSSQNFITVFANDVTIQGLNIRCKQECNKAIEVIGKNFTLKNSELLAVTIPKDVSETTKGTLFSGSIYFNPCIPNSSGVYTSSNDVGTALLENVKLCAWISVPATITKGTVTLRNVTNDFRNNFYANYLWSGTRYEYGVISKNSVIKADGFTVMVDETVYNLKKNVFDRVPYGTTVDLAPGTYYVNSGYTLPDGVTLTGAALTELPSGAVIINNSAELEAAILNQAEGQTWLINSGNYPLVANAKFSAGKFDAQTGWYFPITADALTIIGQGNPVLYGADNTPNGSLASQDLIAVFGDNAILRGLTIMPKVETNKTVEVIGDVRFTVEDCSFVPNTLNAAADPTDGGCLYINGWGKTGTKAITVNRNTFDYSLIALDGVEGSAVMISNNTFTHIMSAYYAIGNTYWGADSRKTVQYADIAINGNSFMGVTASTKLIKARLNQTFILDASNTVNGVAIDKNDSAKYLYFNNLEYYFACKNNKVIVDGVTYESPYKDVDQYVRAGESLQAAVDKAAAGDIIMLAPGTHTVSAQVNISKGITIIGSGTDVTILSVGTDLGNVNGTKHALAIYAQNVQLRDLTIDSALKAYGVNTYGDANATLVNVKIIGSKGAGMTVNGSAIEAINLSMSGNAWGSVNVDPGNGVTTPSIFTLNSGTLADAFQIWSDGKYVTGTATVTVVTMDAYTVSHYTSGGVVDAGTLWTKS